MSIPKFTEKDFYVQCNDSSEADLIFPSVLTGDFQEVAEDAVVEFGVDTPSLNQAGFCWIILKMTVEMDRYPAWKESFKVRTWSHGCEKLCWIRDYQVIDSDGNEIGRGTSDWIVADAATHRPVRPRTVVETFSHVEGYDRLIEEQNDKRMLPFSSPKLDFPEDLASLGEPIISKYADYSELDHNHHVNNTRYISWAYDALHKLGRDVYSVNKFDINYHAEVKAGERVDIYHTEIDGNDFIFGYIDGTKKVFAFRGRR